MNNWWALALFSGAGLASRNVLLKMANFKIDPALAAMILSISMAVTSIVYLIYDRISSSRADAAISVVSSWNWGGVVPAAIAGIGLAAANILLVFSYKAGGSAALVGIMQNLCAVGLTIVIGIFLLKEEISVTQMIGAVVALIGTFLIIRG